MELDTILRELQLEEYRDVLSAGWAESEASFPGAGPPFLQPDAICKWADLAALPAGAAERLVQVAAEVGRRPALARLAWHFHHLLFRTEDFKRHAAARWPKLDETPGRTAGAFYLLVVLSGMPQARDFHARRGIPEEVCRATYADIALWAEEYRENHGAYGIAPRVAGWLRGHLAGEVYRLGRLQFERAPFAGALRAYRSRQSGAVVALAEDGLRFDSEGQFDGVDGVFDPEGAWTSRLVIGEKSVTGSPVSPHGHALQEPVTLAMAEWQPALAPGEPVLAVHIPAGEPMTPDACADAVREALDFFPRYFPECPFKGFACTAWLLDPQFGRLLPAASNIARFQREFYLYPVPIGAEESLRRMFGDRAPALGTADLPADTALRRAVLEHLKGGGRLRAGGGFVLRDDLPWGRQVYRKTWEPLTL